MFEQLDRRRIHAILQLIRFNSAYLKEEGSV